MIPASKPWIFIQTFKLFKVIRFYVIDMQSIVLLLCDVYVVLFILIDIK